MVQVLRRNGEKGGRYELFWSLLSLVCEFTLLEYVARIFLVYLNTGNIQFSVVGYSPSLTFWIF